MRADVCIVSPNLHEDDTTARDNNNKEVTYRHQNVWTWEGSDPTKGTKIYTRHRYLKAVDIVDEKEIGRRQLDDSTASSLRTHRGGESKHRKRKHCHREKDVVETKHPVWFDFDSDYTRIVCVMNGL